MNCFDDQAKMTDALNSQKFITGNYNHYAGECATKERKDKLMEILSEEHDMQFEVFSEMQKRGWYEPKPAPQQKAVSYTHLDVYKRQVLGKSSL